MLVSFKNFSLIVEEKELIKESSFSIEEKEKVGLIGRNGSGKSSVLEVIYKKYKKETLPDFFQIEGKVDINLNLKVAYLKQEVKFNFRGTVEEYLNSCSSFYLNIVKRFEDLNRKKKDSSLATDEKEDLNRLIYKMNFFNLWKYRVRRMKILEKLGLNELLDKNIQNVSGGEATRVGLAGVLLSDADFWILDEPTNNLDQQGISLLLREIQNFKGGVLIVTHDRKLLDQLNKIIEIDEETKKIKVWGGNYSFYKTKKEEEYESRLRKYTEQTRKKQSLKKEAKRLKEIALKIESKSGGVARQAVKLAKRAKAIEVRIAREFANLSEPKLPERPRFPKPHLEELQGSVVRLINVSFYFSKDRILIKDMDLDVNFGDRVLIKGRNGSGKTTLLKLILGELEPSFGVIKRKQNIKIGYLPQSPLILNKKEKVKEYLKNIYHITEDEIKKILNLIKISGVYNLEIGDLSVGEIRRMQIAVILFKNPKLLILDEPTNHLDVYTIEDLTFVLKDYPGTIIFASHDEYFIEDIKPDKVINLD